MNKKIKPQTLKGFRDFLPAAMRVRNYVLGVFKNVFESFGFEPLETPSLEYAETLLGKYGEEADRLVYTFEDRGGRKVAMPYDLTVPTAKVLSLYQNEIPLPFKRYQIQKVFRAEKPQKGRYREILQCDIDTFGIASPLADAEIIAVIYTVLKRLNFEKFTVRINSRRALFRLLKETGIKDKKQQLNVLRVIDKLDKKGGAAVKKELLEKGIANSTGDSILTLLSAAKPDENLARLLRFVKEFGVDEKFYKFDPTLVRGLDYYTGPIFETVVEKPKVGSITGGGRYDNLVKRLGGPDIPATGTTIGLDRICDIVEELGLLKEGLKPFTQILVTVFTNEQSKNLTIKQSLTLANRLRAEGIYTEVYLDPTAPLAKQLKYADRKGIPFVAILGPEEVKSGKAALKNMKSGEQKLLSPSQVSEKLLQTS